MRTFPTVHVEDFSSFFSWTVHTSTPCWTSCSKTHACTMIQLANQAVRVGHFWLVDWPAPQDARSLTTRPWWLHNHLNRPKLNWSAIFKLGIERLAKCVGSVKRRFRLESSLGWPMHIVMIFGLCKICQSSGQVSAFWRPLLALASAHRSN